MTGLPSVFEVFEPSDVVKRRNDAAFKVDLSKAVEGEGLAGDPVEFLRITVPTMDLERVFEEVSRRLAGEGGRGVIPLTARYGGGKTHTLVTLYHTVKHRDVALRYLSRRGSERLRRALNRLEGLDIEVIALDDKMLEHPKRWWADLVERLAEAAGDEDWKERALEEGISARILSDAFDSILSERDGLLILMDEVPLILAMAEDREKAGAYLRQLLEAVHGYEGPVCLVVSIPEGSLTRESLRRVTEIVEELERKAEKEVVDAIVREVSEGANPEAVAERYGVSKNLVERLAEEVREVSGLESVVREEATRESKEFRPVRREEMPEIARTWLLEPKDDVDVKEVVQRVTEAYEEALSKLSEEDVAEVRRRLPDEYPFHPRLLDVLMNVTSEPGYQQTRDYLRFLMFIVARAYELWKEGEWDSPLIDLGDVDVSDEAVSNMFPATLDVAVDDVRNKVKSLTYEGRICNALLVRSVPRRNKGATPRILALDLTRPGVRLAPSRVKEVLVELQRRLDYLHRDGDRFYFTEKRNVWKLLREDHRPSETEVERRLRDALRDELRDRLGETATVRVFEYDNDLEPTLVVVRPEDDPWETHERLEYPNAALLTLDSGAWTEALEHLSYVMAADDALKREDLDDEERAEIRRIRKEEKRALEEILENRLATGLMIPYLNQRTGRIDFRSEPVDGLEDVRKRISNYVKIPDPGETVRAGLVPEDEPITAKQLLREFYSRPIGIMPTETHVRRLVEKLCQQGYVTVEVDGRRYFRTNPPNPPVSDVELRKIRLGHPIALTPPTEYLKRVFRKHPHPQVNVGVLIRYIRDDLQEAVNAGWIDADHCKEIALELLERMLDGFPYFLRHEETGEVVGTSEKFRRLREDIDVEEWRLETLPDDHKLILELLDGKGETPLREILRTLHETYGVDPEFLKEPLKDAVERDEIEVLDSEGEPVDVTEALEDPKDVVIRVKPSKEDEEKAEGVTTEEAEPTEKDVEIGKRPISEDEIIRIARKLGESTLTFSELLGELERKYGGDYEIEPVDVAEVVVKSEELAVLDLDDDKPAEPDPEELVRNPETWKIVFLKPEEKLSEPDSKELERTVLLYGGRASITIKAELSGACLPKLPEARVEVELDDEIHAEISYEEPIDEDVRESVEFALEELSEVVDGNVIIEVKGEWNAEEARKAVEEILRTSDSVEVTVRRIE